MINIREIAKLSGVSTATVSRYINDSGYVSEKSALKIQAVLNERNYSPNKLMQAILNGHTNDIGLIVQNVINPFFAQLMNVLEYEAQKLGYNLIICNANGNEDNEVKYVTQLVGKRVAGFLVLNTTNEKIYENIQLPIIGIEKRIGNNIKITSDNVAAMAILCKTVLKDNKHNILFINGDSSIYSSKIRTKVFEKFCKLNNINYEIMKIEDRFDDFHKFEKIKFKQYSFVFCWNDLLAHKAYLEITKQGLNIPGDIELVGFDGIALNDLFGYQLTTVKQDFKKLGKLTISKMDQLIKGQKLDDCYLSVDIIIGDTTKNNKH